MSTELATQEKAEKMPIYMNDAGMPLCKTIDDVYRMAVMVHKSGLAPKGFGSPESIMVAWNLGGELGLSRMQSLYNICVINGRPTLLAKVLPGIAISKGVLAGFKEHVEGTGDDRKAVVEVKRKGFPDAATKQFSIADAKRASLTGKDNWRGYPDDMLIARARARAFGALFSDVLAGLPVFEDVMEVLSNEKVDNRAAPTTEPIKDALLEMHTSDAEVPAEKPKRSRKTIVNQPMGDGGAYIVTEEKNDLPVEVVQQNIDAAPVTEVLEVESEPESVVTGFVAQEVENTKIENSPGITVKTEAPVYKCKACRDSQKNSKGGPCPLCAPKSFKPAQVVGESAGTGTPDAEGKKVQAAVVEESKKLKNQATESKPVPVEGHEVLIVKTTALGKGLHKFTDEDGQNFYSNAPAVKSVVDLNPGVKIHIGVQDVDGRPTIVSARQIV